MEEYVITPAALRLINPRVVIHTVEKDVLNASGSSRVVFTGHFTQPDFTSVEKKDPHPNPNIKFVPQQ
jgi:hypothetical protein